MEKVLFGLILVGLFVIPAIADTTSRNIQPYNMREKVSMIPDTTIQRLFTVNDMPALGLETVGNFWNDDTIKAKGSFDALRSKEYRGRTKSIRIFVFDSQSTAFKFMDELIVAIIIVPGKNHDSFSGNWWYTESGMPNAIYVNQGNTIIEVSQRYKPYKEVEGELITAAKEIVTRMKAITSKK